MRDKQVSGTSYFFTRDHLGSIREVMGSSGLAARYDYDSWGRRVGEVEELAERWKPIRRGWCFGSEDFTMRMKDTLTELIPSERNSEIWSGAAVEEVEEERATRLLQRAVKALGCSATEEIRGRERYLVAQLLRRKTKVSVGWLTERFGLQTPGGMRYGLHKISQQLGNDKTLQRTWRTLSSL